MPSRKVALKKIPETDAIFAHLAQVNVQADADETGLRLSLDAKATVWVGDYSRGGQSRVTVKAADHDFQPEANCSVRRGQSILARPLGLGGRSPYKK